jgi:hypothetical protein
LHDHDHNAHHGHNDYDDHQAKCQPRPDDFQHAHDDDVESRAEVIGRESRN